MTRRCLIPVSGQKHSTEKIFVSGNKISRFSIKYSEQLRKMKRCDFVLVVQRLGGEDEDGLCDEAGNPRPVVL